jgi:threonine aldolase
LFVKGLGAIGSVLLADKATIHRALRIRKILGGGMRQVGYLAAAGIYALDNNGTSCRRS